MKPTQAFITLILGTAFDGACHDVDLSRDDVTPCGGESDCLEAGAAR
jgi:hypothetical protein